MSKKTIIAGCKLNEYLREKVQRSIIRHKLNTSEYTEYYLVNLLQDFRRSEKLFAENNGEFAEKPLALLLFEAMRGNAGKKMHYLKKVGDTALYLSGFFSENLKKRLVGKNYYARMGGSAYGSLGEIFRNEGTFGLIYCELAQNFGQFVKVLADVSPWQHIHNNTDLLKLYERWLKTGDERVAKVLQREGISVAPTASGDTIQ